MHGPAFRTKRRIPTRDPIRTNTNTSSDEKQLGANSSSSNIPISVYSRDCFVRLCISPLPSFLRFVAHGKANVSRHTWMVSINIGRGVWARSTCALEKGISFCFNPKTQKTRFPRASSLRLECVLVSKYLKIVFKYYMRIKPQTWFSWFSCVAPHVVFSFQWFSTF